ncbi:MAG: TIGR04283 family arsenosugar biosynthesis glycosyltransferase [Sedimenticola sp.]|nr:TIGR04283 family arsenosugar biosynthesis glycosyltransferase [Sedimenticola sp.]
MLSKLSIIIPCLNEEAVIRPLLLSLQSARERGVELVVVDGGSKDSTVQVVGSLVDEVLVTTPGRACQMNAGALVAKGDVLWFLHADSGVKDEYPALLLNALVDSSASWGRFDVTLSGSQKLLRVIEFMMNWRSRLTGIVTGDQGVFIKKSLFQQVGGFPDLPLMEDIQLSTLLRKKHARPLALRERLITSSRRWEQVGIVRTVLLMWRLRLAFFFGVDANQLARRYR